MIGKTLAHYNIIHELGRGGMGIVYKAEDTRLDRTVAIKVLPASALTSPDDKARFYREAKAAASLNHPNIAAIHQIDEAVPEGDPPGSEPRPFIVMEYIEGRTLADRIAEGPLPLEEVVRIASQIAEALKAAHDKPIVHRDIKSANVMLDAEGRAKVLDFGLALTAHSTRLTKMNSTVGTIAYMSPEQALGEEVDHRTDLWSLGVILYEMIVGRHPFPGDYEQAVVYSILNQDPEPLTAIRTGVPMPLEWLVGKLLAKHREERYQSAHDLLVDLKALQVSTKGLSGLSRVSSMQMTGVVPAQARPEPGLVQSAIRAWPVMVGVMAMMLLLGYVLRPQGESPAPLIKTEILLRGIRSVQEVTISPTAAYLALVGMDEAGQSGLFLYETATGNIQYVSDAGLLPNPQFSPSGQMLVFTTETNDLATIVVPSGLPNVHVRLGTASFPVWEDEQTLLYSQVWGAELGIYRLNLADGVTTRIFPFSGNEDYIVSSVLPGSRLAVGWRSIFDNGIRSDPQMLVLDLSSGEVTLGESGIVDPQYVPGGYAVYQLGDWFGRMVARPIDERTGRFTGPPVDLLPEQRGTGVSIGADGSLIYVPGSRSTLQEKALYLVDLETRAVEKINLNLPERNEPDQAAFSPVDDRIAMRILPASEDRYVAVYDPDQGVLSKRTFMGPRQDAAWSADGTWLYYSGLYNDTVNSGFYRRRSDGSGSEEQVRENGRHPTLSPDGKWLGFITVADSTLALVVQDLETGTVVELDTVNDSRNPDFSPDSRYIVYESRRTTGPQIAVRSVAGDENYLVSDLEFADPKWSPDGTHIYFEASWDSYSIYRVPVSTDPLFSVLGAPERVVAGVSLDDVDISRDGTKLVVSSRSEPQREFQEEEPQNSVASLVWWHHWAQTLGRVD